MPDILYSFITVASCVIVYAISYRVGFADGYDEAGRIIGKLKDQASTTERREALFEAYCMIALDPHRGRFPK